MAIISIIIPVFNVEPYLQRCIDSVLSQTFTDFELLLVDDGSTDKSGCICDEYTGKDKRVIVLHQKNAGQGAARNRGIEWALAHNDSQWITFIDSDDFIHKEYLRFLYDEAVSNNADISVCNYLKTLDSSSIAESNEDINSIILSPEELWCIGCRNVPFASLFRKEYFENIRFPEGIIFEDAFTMYKLLFKSDKIVYLDNILYYYCLREGSTLISKWSPRKLQQFRAIEEQMTFFNSNGYKKALQITQKYYVYQMKSQVCDISSVKKEFFMYYCILTLKLKLSLFLYRKNIPICNNTNLYRFVFPFCIFLYKKLEHLKMRFS